MPHFQDWIKPVQEQVELKEFSDFYGPYKKRQEFDRLAKDKGVQAVKDRAEDAHSKLEKMKKQIEEDSEYLTGSSYGPLLKVALTGVTQAMDLLHAELIERGVRKAPAEKEVKNA